MSDLDDKRELWKNVYIHQFRIKLRSLIAESVKNPTKHCLMFKEGKRNRFYAWEVSKLDDEFQRLLSLDPDVIRNAIFTYHFPSKELWWFDSVDEVRPYCNNIDDDDQFYFSGDF